nr:hypothetical protein [Tanacetum cinerariifolium]
MNLGSKKIRSLRKMTKGVSPSYRVPTARISSYCQRRKFPLLKKRDATAEKIALLLKSSSNCQSKSYDSYAKKTPHVQSYPKEDAATTSDGSVKKKGRTVAVTTEDMQKRKNDVKARTTLLLSLPDEHQLRFSKYKTAQELWAVILKTFGGNKATKKIKKNLLKQQYENFKTEGKETLEQTFNRLQVIVSQLEFMDIEIEQDDLNQKFLTSLALEWLMHTIKKSESNSQNMAFISSAKHISGNEEVNTASTNVSLASANIRAASISQDTACTYIASQSNNVAGFDKSKVECFNCHKMGHFVRECRASRSQDKGRRDNYRQGSKVEEHTPKALMAIDGVGWDWSFMENEQEDHALVADEEASTEFALMAKTSLSQVEGRLAEFKNQEIKFCKKIRGLELQVEFKTNRIESLTNELELLKKEKGLLKFVDDTITDYSRPPPTVESKSDDLQNKNPSVTETEPLTSTILSKPDIKLVKATNRTTKTKTAKVITAKPAVKYAELYRKPSKGSKVRGNQRNWNNLKSQQLGENFVMKNKACFNCGYFDHLTYDCGLGVKNGRSWVKNNNTRKSMSPRPTIHRPYRPPMRPVRPNMNVAQPKRTSFHKLAHSYSKRPFQRTSAVRSQFRAPWVLTVNRNFPTVNKKFPIGSTNFFTADMGKKGNAVKASACWISKPRQNITTKGPNSNSVSVMFKKYTYIDTQGRLKHITGNISYLSDYEPFDGGYVSFSQGGCKITGKGTIKTKCIVLGRNFKLSDDTNVLLRTHRQHNMYSINLNNIVPHKDLICLVAKASADECMLWHRRPGKQHKASYKTKLVNSVTKPLYTLHMDLFDPTSDETSGILRNFVTEIENLKELRVKIIRCDNGGEFRNKEMNDFCSWKGIKREFSNARTPQQNGIAIKRNMTLTEAAKTMLADAKLPVTFWAKAVNNACYVQNRVLVNKSQNKTPYELFNGRTPVIGFLKPFGCHVMILNTLDNLGKFEAKGDEGYFIGYSMSSKEFKVFNKRTKRVEENLHVDFLENKAIEKGAVPNWLFDIDSLTNSMNYVPVVGACTHSTNFLGTKDAASQEVKKYVSSLRYIALPNWVHDALLESTSSNAQDTCTADAPKSSGNPTSTASTTNPLADPMETLAVENSIPTVSLPVPTACLNDSPEPSSDTRLISKRVTSQDDTPSLDNILTLTNRFEDILGVSTNTDDTHGEEADIGNMKTTITTSPTPTIRIHKDHPKSQIIGHVDTSVQTKTKSKEMEEQKPKKIFNAFQDPSWVFKNKKDERGIVIRNKARLVAQGHTQEEGIDYDEVFTPVARIKAIRLFLAYASFMGFTVYLMDVKSAFLYASIDEEVYVMQPPGFQDLEFLAKVYKVEKVISSNTPMDKENPWGKDGTGKDVDLHIYRSMIGSLMYLTASRPDIMFVVCACARHQVTPKECHLHAVKRIFRYLKGHPKLRLWYPKESPFDLVAYSDSDYGGATQDRKSTTEGCQFLGRRLISWQCKKQIIVATSTTEAEYVAAASGCGQVL